MNERRELIRLGLGAGGLALMGTRAGVAAAANSPGMNAPAEHVDGDAPILVAIELSGGNDGLNTVVPFGDDAYYRHRPRIGIRPPELLKLDDHYGLNPGMQGAHRLWQQGRLAIIHGCGYAQPSYSHFTSMAYWHTASPNQGNEYGWMGRVADQMSPQRQDNLLINIGSSQSLAVKSKIHTPVVFNDPERFQRNRWLMSTGGEVNAVTTSSGNPTRDYLHAVNASAAMSSRQIRQAWRDYQSPVDYGISPMDLPKVAACIQAGLPARLYYVAFQNNAFDTHVNQPALHRRLLSYAFDGVYGFLQDIERIGQADRVVVMIFSEFGRRVPENANLGTDHGTANLMFMAGKPVRAGHYGEAPSLTRLVDGDNLQFTTDFRRVYASAIENWLRLDSAGILGGKFEPIDLFA